MTDGTLNAIVSLGQYVALALAILAAIAGGVVGIAGQKLSKRSDDALNTAKLQLIRLQTENAKLTAKVSRIIGDEWEPLTASQVADLRTKIRAIGLRGQIGVNYKNSYGRNLATSIANAFEGTECKVYWLGLAPVIETGMETRPGPKAEQIASILREITKIDVKASRTEEPEQNNPYYAIDIGAKP